MIGMTPNYQVNVIQREAVRFEAIAYRRRKIEPAASPPDSVTLQPRHTFARDS
jgi:hypothetical protein